MGNARACQLLMHPLASRFLLQRSQRFVVLFAVCMIRRREPQVWVHHLSSAKRARPILTAAVSETTRSLPLDFISSQHSTQTEICSWPPVTDGGRGGAESKKGACNDKQWGYVHTLCMHIGWMDESVDPRSHPPLFLPQAGRPADGGTAAGRGAGGLRLLHPLGHGAGACVACALALQSPLLPLKFRPGRIESMYRSLP